MPNNLKLQEAIEIAKEIQSAVGKTGGIGLIMQRTRALEVVISAAQSIIDKWEVTKIARTANNEIIAITYEGKQYYPKELHPAVGEAKQMTVAQIKRVILDNCGYESTYNKPMYDLCEKIATALFEAVYGKEVGGRNEY